VDCEATNLNAVLACDVFDLRRLAYNLDEFLTSIAVLVELSDIARTYFCVQRDIDCML